MKLPHALCSFGLAVLLAAPAAAERKVVTPGVLPQRHAGQVYVAARLASALCGAELRWREADQSVEIGRSGRVVRFRLGSPEAMVNGRAARLKPAPYRREGQAMVPLRLIGEALGVPVGFEPGTESVVVGPGDDGVLWTLPLETRRQGIVVHSPEPGSEWTKIIRVHGQMNVPGANVVFQLQDADGKVLTENSLRPEHRGSGQFGEFIHLIGRAESGGGTREVRVVVFAVDPDTGRELHRVAVPVTLHLSD
ncbi:MAG: stalk domain-containing protein [Armatimonadota bacterium]